MGELMRIFKKRTGGVPGLYKADVDSAFRRVPIFPGHRWACCMAFLHKGVAHCAEQLACPLGAVGSVVAWERIGAALAFLAQVLLKLAVLR
eukprot:6409325-Karenia_brevis.AAC.2